MKPRSLFLSALVLGAMWSCRAQNWPILAPTVEPKTETMWTSTREIRGLQTVGKEGEIWAATAGGVVRLGCEPRQWTRKTGLPSNEAMEIETLNRAVGGAISVRFPLHRAVFDGKSWAVAGAPPYQKTDLTAVWQGHSARATLDGLQIDGRAVGNPPSSGTHISALLPLGKTLVAAFYGDGLWNFDGKNWARDARNAGLNSEAREITALAGDAGSLLIGTRRAGIWASYNGQAWRRAEATNGAEIDNANLQNFAEFRGILWASTLDDGLIYRSGEGWGHVAAPDLSSIAPRQMLVFRDQLFVRHGGGLVDSFDGRNWEKNALASIPRKGIYALAGDEKTLFAAGWGGWSEWDGARWTPHFGIAQLKGVPLMGLFLDGDYLWIATQSRGLGRYNRADKTFRWFDERDNLPDDWVTATAKLGGHIYAGTFVGGLARLDGDGWHVFEAMRGQNVTAIAESGGQIFAATRSGLWQIRGDAAARVEKSWLDPEIQTLHAGKTGLWVGARTSLSWLKDSSLS